MAKVTTVGDRVMLKKDKLVGVCRFIGGVKGKSGVFYGIELDDTKGKNDGSVASVFYFKCPAKKGLFVKASGISKTNAKRNPDAPRVTVGDTVHCIKQKCVGKIRFIGTPYSVKKSGTYYGMELEKPNGKNNGTVRGQWYFTCKDKYGCFVQATGFTVENGKNSKNGKKVKKKKSKSKKQQKEEKEEEKERETPTATEVTEVTESQIAPSTESTEPQNRKTDSNGDGHDKWRTLRQAFKSMDSDGNMSIEPEEFKSMAQEVFKCNQSQCDLLFAEIDVNGSGSISFAEFDGWIKRIGGIESVDQRIAALQDEAKESAAEVTTKVTKPQSTEVEDEKADAISGGTGASSATTVSDTNDMSTMDDNQSELSVDDAIINEVDGVDGVDQKDEHFDDDTKEEVLTNPEDSNQTKTSSEAENVETDVDPEEQQPAMESVPPQNSDTGGQRNQVEVSDEETNINQTTQTQTVTVESEVNSNKTESDHEVEDEEEDANSPSPSHPDTDFQSNEDEKPPISQDVEDEDTKEDVGKDSDTTTDVTAAVQSEETNDDENTATTESKSDNENDDDDGDDPASERGSVESEKEDIVRATDDGSESGLNEEAKLANSQSAAEEDDPTEEDDIKEETVTKIDESHGNKQDEDSSSDHVDAANESNEVAAVKVDVAAGDAENSDENLEAGDQQSESDEVQNDVVNEATENQADEDSKDDDPAPEGTEDDIKQNAVLGNNEEESNSVLHQKESDETDVISEEVISRESEPAANSGDNDEESDNIMGDAPIDESAVMMENASTEQTDE